MSNRYLHILVIVLIFALSGCEDVDVIPEGTASIQVEYNMDAEVTTVLLTGEPGAMFKIVVLRNHEYVEDRSLLASMMTDMPIRRFDEQGNYELSLDSSAMLKSESIADDVQGYLLFCYCDESGLCEELIVEPLFVKLPEDESGSVPGQDKPTDKPEPDNPSVEPDLEQPSDEKDITIEDYNKDPEAGTWA